MLAVRLRKSFTEIDEGWSQRDVNLMLFYLHAQSIANEPNDREFFTRIAELMSHEC